MSAKIGTPEWLEWNEAERKKHDAKNADKAKRIVSLIDPAEAKRRACLDDALKAIWQMEDDGSFSYSDPIYGKMRKKLDTFARAMARVSTAWKDMMAIGVGIHADVDVKLLNRMDDFLAFGRQCAVMAEENKTKLQDRDARMKVHAVRHAYKLVRKYGVKPSSKKGSEFCSIAKLLHGGRDDLTRQCKTYAEEHSEVRARRQAKKARA